MSSKEEALRQLTQATEAMVQGSLSELTRQCGDPSCACAHDPARRHGPHLYLKFNAEGKTHSVYVPPVLTQPIKAAHAAWLRFLELGARLAEGNRARLLRAIEREKRQARARRGKAR